MSIHEIPAERIRELTAVSHSYREILRKIGYCKGGRAHYLIKKAVASAGASTSHFKHGAPFPKKLTDKEYFRTGARHSGTGLKIRLLKYGHLEEICDECGIGPAWNGKPLSLQVDHINGQHDDCRLENLRIVCPNCHVQTSTYAGRRFRKPKNLCTCGVEIHKKNRSGKCAKCSRSSTSEKTRKFKATKQELEKLVNSHSLAAIGVMFGVSGHTVRKYCHKWRILPPRPAHCPIV